MTRILSDDELRTCHVYIHEAALVCAGISALAGEGAAIGADTWFLRGTQGLMFTQLARVLKVPMTASSVYAFKEFWSGAVIGVAGARILISWLGIGGHAASVGTASAPITGAVRGINSTLSTIITEKMGWGYVRQVEKRRMTFASQLAELGRYTFGQGLNALGEEVFDLAGEGLADVASSEGAKEALQRVPEQVRSAIGVLYTEIHELGLEDYAESFTLAFVGQYQSAAISGTPIRTKDIVMDSLVTAGAFAVLDKQLDAPVTQEVVAERERVRKHISNTPEVFAPFLNTLTSRLTQLESPTRDVIKQFKDSHAMAEVANAAADAIKVLVRTK